MGTLEALNLARICRCSEMPAGTLLQGDWSNDEYIAHLEQFLSVYYVCPLTRVMWVCKHGGDGRISFPEYEHTGYRLPTPSVYTVAEVDAALYEVPSKPSNQVIFKLPHGVQLPEFPALPLTGLIKGLFIPRSSISWQWEIFQVSGEIPLSLWLHLWRPLDRGKGTSGWLVEPFGVATGQILQSGLQLEWVYATRNIGQVLVNRQIQVEPQSFWEVFGRGKPYRDLGAEFSDWLEKAQ